jgi:branched-chain amino acid transport system ATP-binding protein
MELVMNVCSHIYVLDFGTLLFEGDPASVAASPAVQAAYLGYASTDAVA